MRHATFGLSSLGAQQNTQCDQNALRVAAATGQRKSGIAFARQKFIRIGVLSRSGRDQASNHLQEGLLLRTVSSCKEIGQLNL
jgi:hypothetical protein